MKTYKEKEMVDFRRMIPVLAVLALLLGSAVTASAQTPLQCFTIGGVNTPDRSEGLTEETGDVQIYCTGGTPTAPGAAVASTVNIQVFLNTTITSRLMSTGTTLPAPSEALLLLNEPAPGAQYACPAQTCTNLGGTTFGPGTAGTLGNNKNVFQGLQTASNSVTFIGIPVDPPGTAGSLQIRITNLRANTNALGVAGANATPTSVIATVTATPFNFLPVSNPVQTVGSVQRGLQFSVGTSGTTTTAFTPRTFQQCISQSNTSTVAVLRYQELFPTAFKKYNIGSSAASPTATAPQNSLTVGNYNTESAFYSPQVNAALPTVVGTPPGLADWGTRLKAVFNNIPNGANLYVAVNPIGVGGTSGGINALNGTLTPDRAQLISNENGPYAAVAASGAGPAGTVALTAVNGSATAVWEVTESDSLTFAVLAFPVYITYTASPATNSPALATGTVNGSYAPTSTIGTAQNTTIPRFADTSSASNLLTIVPCATNLLFPYLTSQFGFDTGIAISNTSTDPFGTSAQTGTCTLNWYGTAFTGATSTPVVNSGSTYVTLASSTLSNVTGGFTGYMIAVCRFQYAHGFAFVSDLGARNLAMGYLALIIPDPPRSANGFDKAGTGAGEMLGQ
jgi:hypothetical protein